MFTDVTSQNDANEGPIAVPRPSSAFDFIFRFLSECEKKLYVIITERQWPYQTSSSLTDNDIL